MRSIRIGLANRLGGAALLLLLVGGGGLYFSLREALERQFDRVLIAKAEALIMASEFEDGVLEIDPDVETFAGFGTGVRGNYFVILDDRGRVKTRSSSLGITKLTTPESLPVSKEGFANIVLPEDVSGRSYWTTYQPSLEVEEGQGAPSPSLKILIASSDATLRRTLRTTAGFVSIFGLIGVFATFVISKSGVRSGLKPLEVLSSEVEQIDPKRLSRRVSDEDMPQELLGISSKINELLGRLEDSFDREKRFSSNAAHELRTPLAELRTMTELGTRWPDEFTEEHGNEMLEVISELEGLLGTLSLLSRAESEAVSEKSNLALEEIIPDQIEKNRPRIEERRQELRLEIEASEIHTDPVLFRAILQNLLDNAIDYSPEGSQIRIVANRKLLVVENQAKDLTADDLSQLFARFWRKSKSRSEKEHSGLGLSVVRAGVEHLGGSCSADLDEGRLQVKIGWESES